MRAQRDHLVGGLVPSMQALDRAMKRSGTEGANLLAKIVMLSAHSTGHSTAMTPRTTGSGGGADGA